MTEVKSLQLGDIAPDFSTDTSTGAIRFHEWAGDSWVVFFSHPKDYTPVCTTELGEAARRSKDFAARNVKILALSVDSAESHRGWLKDIEETQKAKIDYPIVADETKKVAALYGMIHPALSDTFTVRSVFLIDPKKKVRLVLTYPMTTGRNFDEILRCIDSIQLTDKYAVATPVNWKDGGECVIPPSIKDPAEMKAKYPKGWRELKPYLRMTPQPNK
jgi:alkyl hydroperoxide reductase subunit AhpC